MPNACTSSKAEPESVLAAEAIDIRAIKLRTPLQVQLHLTLALGWPGFLMFSPNLVKVLDLYVPRG